ncbi:MAG: hypothetical protein U0807_10930 [Candidatus Binatia bacterium]
MTEDSGHEVRRTWGIVGGAAMLAVALWAPSARANNILLACGDYCTTSCGSSPPPGCHEASSNRCELGPDLSCPSGPALRVEGGVNLDLHGASVTCSTPTGCAGEAIAVTSASSKVYNTLQLQSVIAGPWSFGVNCNGQTTTEVDGITIHDALWGVYRCARVHHSFIGRPSLFYYGANIGVYTDTYSNSDYINDNYFQDRTFPIQLGSGNKGINIERNVIETTVGTSPVSYGAAAAVYFASAASPAIVRHNVVLGNGSTIFGAPFPVIFYAPGPLTAATFENNVCSRSHPDCGSCQAQGYCMTPRSPFTL